MHLLRHRRTRLRFRLSTTLGFCHEPLRLRFIHGYLALPRIRQILVPQVGHGPLAMFMPVLDTSTVP